MIDFLLNAGMVLGAAGVYTSFVGKTAKYIASHDGWQEEYSVVGVPGPIAYIGGLLWPITMPLTLSTKLSNRVLSFRPKVPAKLLKNELIPGVEKPTDILHGLVAARMLQDLPNVRIGYETVCWTSPDKKIDIRAEEWRKAYDVSLTVGGKTFHGIKTGPLADIIPKVKKLKDEADQQRRLMQTESQAVEALEQFLLEPVKEAA